jgi:hypothetical protein
LSAGDNLTLDVWMSVKIIKYSLIIKLIIQNRNKR